MTEAPQRPLSQRPPSPSRFPLLGHVPSFVKDPPGFLRKAFELGDVVRLDVGSWLYAVHKAEHVKQILHDDHRLFCKGMDQSKFVPLFGTGLIISEGELWKRQRRLVQPAFVRNRLDTFVGPTNARTEQLVERWRSYVESGAPFDVHAEAMALTLAILGDSVFSVDLSDNDPKHVGDALATALRVTIDRHFSPLATPMWMPTPTIVRYKQALATLREVVDATIAQRRAAAPTDDLLGRLMSACEDDVAPMSNEQLRDEVLTMLLAGHESSALTLSWTLWELALQPELQDAVAEEIERVVGSAAPSADAVPKLELTTRCIEESLRLHPPIWLFQRRTLELVNVGGFPIGAGEVVWLVPYLTHRNPDYWPDPERFDPSRFEESAKAARPRFAYYPFGGGPRMCVGASLAVMTEALLLVAVLRRFRVVPVEERPPVHEYSFSLRPKEGVWLRLLPRDGSRTGAGG